VANTDNAKHDIHLGAALHRQGRLAEAEAHYHSALGHRPDLPEAWTNLGLVRMALGAHDEAETCHREALRLDPAFADAHNNLGVVHYQLGRVAEAENCFRGGLRLNPDYAGAQLNLAVALQALGRLDEAETCYRAAHRLGAEPAQVHSNLGVLLREQGRFELAEAFSREALRLRPDLADARVNLAMVLLLTGRWSAAWPLYESRWEVSDMARQRRDFSQPQLSPQSKIDGQVILLHAEQGFGDTLQFCRYAPLLAKAGARIILEVQPSLARLMATLPGVETVLSVGDAVPHFDLHCPLMSLPLAFGTTPETIPSAPRYLAADPDLTAFWQRRLAFYPGLRVGLAWAGSSRAWLPHAVALDRRRSMRLGDMAPLAAVPNCSFISLQLGPAAQQLQEPPAGLRVHEFADQLPDFADTAALIENLDLIISVDTAVAHLAGALGKPVWLLNRFDTCWRWLLERDDSPWYPSLRLFRHAGSCGWSEVMERVNTELRQLTAVA
jgi:tetratricopeptide (TPR) repeat protein